MPPTRVFPLGMAEDISIPADTTTFCAFRHGLDPLAFFDLGIEFGPKIAQRQAPKL
jgi:hypothetical protein